MKCMKCGRSSAAKRNDVKCAAGGSYDALLCAACYADEFGMKDALFHFSAKEIEGERKRRAAAAAEGGAR